MAIGRAGGVAMAGAVWCSFVYVGVCVCVCVCVQSKEGRRVDEKDRVV